MSKEEDTILNIACSECDFQWNAISYRRFMRHYNKCRIKRKSLDKSSVCKSNIICGGCGIHFTRASEDRNIRKFRHHLLSQHVIAPKSHSSEASTQLDDSQTDTTGNTIVEDVELEPNTLDDYPDGKKINGQELLLQTEDMLNYGYKFILKLHGDSHFTQTATQFVIQNTQTLMSSVHERLVSAIQDMKHNNEVDFNLLSRIIDESKECLNSFSTQHRRLKIFEENGWVKPISVAIGHRVDTTIQDGTSVQKSVAVTYQYVPLISSIQFILSNPKIRTLLLRSMERSCNNINNFMDGSKFADLSKDNSLVHLVISLYCDDIEVINPLGANSGVHKLTMYYFSILNLPPELLTSTDHIHLIAVAAAQDVKAVGHNMVLSRFVEDMKILQRGILFDGICTKVTLGVVCADNLAANSLINMTESFSSDYYCRFCVMHRADTQKSWRTPDFAVLRNDEVQKAAADTLALGVKGSCILDELDSFSSVENYSPDIMHDLLEGVCRLELGLIICYYLTEKLFSLEFLNGAIDAFSYSYHERSTRPRLIPKPVSGKLNLKQSASMMLTLMRTLPLIIGHVIQEDCLYWLLYKQLREILDIVMSPVLSIEVSYYIESIVNDHHNLFLELFPNKNLTPKHHFMLHYGEAIRRCGPLRHLWCMRFESKHQMAKKVGDLSNNFRNIAVTVATQYSLSTFSNWTLNNIWPLTTVGSSLGNNKVSSLTYRGVLFKPGCIIHHGLLNDNPKLSMIDSIMCDGTSFIFHCKRLHVDNYCEHFCAFPVRTSEIRCDVVISDLKCTQPLFMHKNQHEEEFVYLPCKFTTSFNATGLY